MESQVAGADSHRASWVVVAKMDWGITDWKAPNIEDAVRCLPEGAVLAIDIHRPRRPAKLLHPGPGQLPPPSDAVTWRRSAPG